ncbi:Armadillo repeat-containing protein 7 [Rhizopus stolonifer]|uniref:Armadillo repeat-containing protein 7 n=1 Tax=Rhizopus stolonifer TaxID=4846 RepID=A0A367JD04_RHIST|nr:Armadillo repeat-containing protein 7 [Rhizopus stolonifer]
MFQSKSYIEKRHGKDKANRTDYLTQLVQEYQVTTSQEARQQILAHLANFAYDPINYNTLWDLYAVDLFLDALNDSNLQEFGMGGLANICLAEPRHHEYILSQPSFRHAIVQCLDTSCTVNTQLNAMTTLMQLITQDNYTALLTAELEQYLKRIQSQKDKQTSTMASLFLKDYYHH